MFLELPASDSAHDGRAKKRTQRKKMRDNHGQRDVRKKMNHKEASRELKESVDRLASMK